MIRILRFFCSTLLVLLLVACAATTSGSADSAAVAEKYPPGSIQTWSLSRGAIADVAAARGEIDVEFNLAQVQCAKKFFVSRCVDEARKHRRNDLAMLRKIEIEANAFQRKARAADRDLSLIERERKSDGAPLKNVIPSAILKREGRPGAGSFTAPED